jgi:septum formation protein
VRPLVALPPVVLASASPRRADLLAAAGLTFEVRPVEVDERPVDGEDPGVYALRVALDKARACPASPGDVVLAADTVVVVGGLILGKPADDRDAARMLGLLSGRVHDVLTAVVVRSGEREAAAVESTAVTFVSLTEDDIAWYVASGEPRDKAGAYAVQGLASRFVARIDGSYSNVVGLPIAVACRMLTEFQPGEVESSRVGGGTPGGESRQAD